MDEWPYLYRAGELAVILILAQQRLKAKVKRKDTVTSSDGAQRNLSVKHADSVPLGTLQRPSLAMSQCLQAMLSYLNTFGWCAQREKLHPAGIHSAIAGEKKGNASQLSRPSLELKITFKAFA